MNKRESKIIKSAVEIFKRYLSPKKIFFFGSRVKKENKGKSDFDFAIDCKPPNISIQRRIKDDIEKISGLYKIDIVYLPEVDPDFRKIIISTGKVIYEE